MINDKLASLQFKEMFRLWSQLGVNQSYIASSHAFFNHTRDKKLKIMILEFIQCLKEENKQLTLLLKENGVLAPTTTMSYSKMKMTDIRGKSIINDSEISAILSMNIASSLLAVSQALELSVKKKHLAKYGELHMRYAILGSKLIELSKIKGWLLAPAQ
ncbi:DUF3231 family protein [Lysinibacillus sp. FSL M8-0216]|uniref:DUF3231 domain-containing protein n=1 Tax=Lysinibacillus fusiformis TaxID=28031 RepID=A0A1H9SA17_9BACI|nr:MULTISPECIES: DUF3231 family protein [Lysinibacillus]EAZ84966.1 hypothetical protein BB14905_00010 [Bacillus sp. B14905]MCG7437609.1 DUF3231 family protein [Lysinibacillus fusiformis]MED4077796.1 DUF3231 family protein [Lysinibacillus fusiformis]MED4671599.1 DUF3231 family protein [Lysinibacillus fusiformis]NOG26776.1 DUF3231 family protein [Lysinibacillus fusiformis]